MPAVRRSSSAMGQSEAYTYEELCETWRKKVFQLLMEKKRYELIMADNLAQYNQSTKKLKLRNQELTTSYDLLMAKYKELEQQFTLKTNLCQDLSFKLEKSRTKAEEL